MRLHVEYWPNGETTPTTLVIRPATQLRWEKSTKRRMSDLGDGIGVQDALAFLRLETDYPGTIDELALTLDDINVAPGNPPRPEGEASPE